MLLRGLPQLWRRLLLGWRYSLGRSLQAYLLLLLLLLLQLLVVCQV